jgi:hypothetical protein
VGIDNPQKRHVRRQKIVPPGPPAAEPAKYTVSALARSPLIARYPELLKAGKKAKKQTVLHSVSPLSMALPLHLATYTETTLRLLGGAGEETYR